MDLITASERLHGDASLKWQGLEAVAIAAAEKAAAKPLSELRTPDEIAAALDATPLVFKQDLLFALWRRGRLEPQHLRRVMLEVWRYTDFPSVGCPAAAWLAMFRAVGFLSDGTPKPSRPITVYRGCTAQGRRGMSWTAERSMAEWFANHWFEIGQADAPGHVYKTTVGPRDILAIMPEKKVWLPGLQIEAPIKPEHDVIIDARSLPIVLVEPARRRIERNARDEARDEARNEAVQRLAAIAEDSGVTERERAAAERKLHKLLGM